MTGVEKVSLVLTGLRQSERFSDLLKEKTTMISAKCELCGWINDFADEACQKCGAELSDSAKIFYRGTADYEPPPAHLENSEDQSSDFATTPAIGPFLGVSSVLGPAISIFISNFWLIAKIVLVVVAPLEIFKALSIGNKGASWQVGAGTTFLGLFCKALVAPSLIFALMSVIRTGVSPSLNDSYRWGLSRLGTLIRCAMMAWFLEALGFFCLIIPGLILAAAFELIYPMASLENRGPIEILKRSYHLTKGHRWNIFWATFLLGLLGAVVAIPVGGISVILISVGTASWPLQAALSMVTDIVNESMTILSLVIYLSILKQTPTDGLTDRFAEV
jgi:uncharacterized membrane protein